MMCALGETALESRRIGVMSQRCICRIIGWDHTLYFCHIVEGDSSET